MPPDPLSYNMSDVNPHLTRCEPPPYIKAGSAPELVIDDTERLHCTVVLLLLNLYTVQWEIPCIILNSIETSIHGFLTSS